MPTTVSFRFPLGRYHATPWGRSVNEAQVEWPPSPWRLLRALVSTWYQRAPEISADQLDQLVDRLRVPPSYRTPAVEAGHTRHYMPDRDHKSGGTSNTDKVIDSYVWVRPEDCLLVQWDVDLEPGLRDVLACLLDRLPYLGRSESLTDAKLLDSEVPVGADWWRPGATTAEAAQLLCLSAETRRAELELGTLDLRKLRVRIPPTSQWLTYRRPDSTDASDGRQGGPSVLIEAIRWRIQTTAPMKDEHGILATEGLRSSRLRAFRDPDVPPAVLRGKRTDHGGPGDHPMQDDHSHAHWLWLSDGPERAIRDLALWVPAGVDSSEAIRMLHNPAIGKNLAYSPDGFRPASIQVVAMGTAAQALPELCGPASNWVSRTPYLPVRYRKRNRPVETWIAGDIAKECEYRGIPQPVEVRIIQPHERPRPQAYRRYRWQETMRSRREGHWVEVEFVDAIRPGALSLGALSHFGFGLFQPAT